jgi:DNA processing protein
VARQPEDQTLMPNEAVAALALLMTPGAGNVTVNQALAGARRGGLTLGELLTMPTQNVVEALPPGSGDAAYVVSRCPAERLEHAKRLMDRTSHSGVQALLAGNGDYPESLQTSLGTSAPPIVFVAGDVERLGTQSAGIVGARYASKAGLFLAAECARVFAKASVPVVSGGAKGVDSTAHEAALANNGSTVVVLAEGLLRWKGPKSLLEAAEDGRATLISEFPPDAAWTTHAAVTRNATISALSTMLCVIEPRKEGGSIRTARCGMDQGKPVLVHAAKDDETAAAGLRKRGARLLVKDNAFNAERLTECWNSSGTGGPAQQDLF